MAVLVTVHLGEALGDLRPAVEGGLEQMRQRLSARLGVAVPPLRLSRPGMPAEALPASTFRVDVDDVPFITLPLDPTCSFVEEMPEAIAELGVSTTHAPGPFGPESLVVAAGAAAPRQDAGLLLYDPAEQVCRMARQALLAHAGQLIGIQETQTVLREVEAHFPELVREASRAYPLPRMSDVLRRLVAEQVPLRNIRQVLEAVAEWTPREQTTGGLVEHVRVSLRRQLCHAWSVADKVITALTVEGQLEEALRPLLRATPQGTQLGLEQPMAERLIGSVRAQLSIRLGRDRPAVVLTAADLR